MISPVNIIKRWQSSANLSPKYNYFSSKGPFSSIPTLELNNTSLILKLPPMCTYYIRSLNFTGIIQQNKKEAVAKESFFKSLFFKKINKESNTDLNIQLIKDNCVFQKINTLNKPSNILININTNKIFSLDVDYSKSYTILNPNENILSYSENITRSNSTSDVETIGGMGIITFISDKNIQILKIKENENIMIDINNLLGFENNNQLKFEIVNSSRNYVKCIGTGDLIIKK
ncbi:hypothetical protein FOG51_01711 [Hanseniaspora uvarum]|uniref:Altered inheritance of mitochondria protein 24, mitochondrial n=1 Tax=Hanseniaspora uvarum TaxID=29833 RepID=A0A1E5RY12_HANUV|nr:hypothetical protein FOG48_00297 [Hanseniaspora uvarum]KAF0273209.1 hypothetical protein FOG51_01711 [Hanseniaspora uvarum]KAF0278931.1 hypothetical protein FOG50_00210 [Hanseniaspora uvarum]KKA03431.1 hypothetical protein D499_0B01750 [Hanseniaspora uvarum DSM 2768]